MQNTLSEIFLKDIFHNIFLNFEFIILKVKKYVPKKIFQNNFFYLLNFLFQKHFCIGNSSIPELPKSVKSNNLNFSKNIRMQKENYRGAGRKCKGG